MDLIENPKKDFEAMINAIDKKKAKISYKSTIENNTAMKLAKKLEGTMPSIYSSYSLSPAGYRFKASLNENSKVRAIHVTLPELCHNEISCWTKNKDSLIPILIRDKDEPNHIKLRFTFIKNMLKSNNIQFIELLVRGEDKLSRIITGIYILDYVSFYLAILNNINPTTTSNIDNLKKFLKK